MPAGGNPKIRNLKPPLAVPGFVLGRKPSMTPVALTQETTGAGRGLSAVGGLAGPVPRQLLGPSRCHLGCIHAKNSIASGIRA